jgi:hypothetical protein
MVVSNSVLAVLDYLVCFEETDCDHRRLVPRFTPCGFIRYVVCFVVAFLLYRKLCSIRNTMGSPIEPARALVLQRATSCIRHRLLLPLDRDECHPYHPHHGQTPSLSSKVQNRLRSPQPSQFLHFPSNDLRRIRRVILHIRDMFPGHICHQ